MRCKAEAHNKKRCKKDAVLYGFCTRHFGMLNIKKVKIYGKLKWEKRNIVDLNSDILMDLRY